jgi:hypothetical protein
MRVLLWLVLATLAVIVTFNAWLISQLLRAARRAVAVPAQMVIIRRARAPRPAPLAVTLIGPRVVSVASGSRPIRRRNR